MEWIYKQIEQLEDVSIDDIDKIKDNEYDIDIQIEGDTVDEELLDEIENILYLSTEDMILKNITYYKDYDCLILRYRLIR